MKHQPVLKPRRLKQALSFCIILVLLASLQTNLLAVNHNPDTPDEEKFSTLELNVPSEVQASSSGKFSIKWNVMVSEEGDDGNGLDEENITITLESQAGGVLQEVSTSGTSGSVSSTIEEAEACEVTVTLESEASGESEQKTVKITVGGSGGGSGGGNGSVRYYYGLGSVAQGRSGGRLLIESDDPTPLLYNPQGIRVTADESIKIYNNPATNAFSQALSDTRLTTITVVNSSSYEIRSYKSSQVTNANTNGPWTVVDTNDYFKKTLVENPGNTEILNTTDDTLYHTERNGNSFSYDLALPSLEGDYLISLHFSENFHDAAGERLMDIFVEDQLTLDDLDIFSEAGGKNNALEKTIPVTIKDGSLDLDFVTSFYQSKLAALSLSKAPASDILDTEDDALFYSERTGTQFAYNIPVANGDYEITLYFSERYYDEGGKRLFDVHETDHTNVASPLLTTLLEDYDVRNSAGALDTAITETFSVSIFDGSIDLTFLAEDALARLAAIKVTQDAPLPLDPEDPPLPPILIAAINAGGVEFTAGDTTLFVADTNFNSGEADIADGSVIHALNAGSDADYTAANGITYQADTYFIGGKAFFNGGTAIRFNEEEDGLFTHVYDFSWVNDPVSGEIGDSILSTGLYLDGGEEKFLKIDNKQVDWSLDRLTRTETRIMTNSDSEVASKMVEVYEIFPFGERMVRRVLNPDGLNGEPLTTSWTYYDNGGVPGDSDIPGYGKIKEMVRYDGYWEQYEYDEKRRRTKVLSQYLNSTLGDEANAKILNITYSDNNPIETRVTTIKGQEVKREFVAEFINGDEIEEWNIIATEVGVDWNAPSNLVTKSCRYSSDHSTENLQGRSKWTEFPDGTMTIYTYSLNGTEETITEDNGAPNAAKTAIIEGTRSVTVKNALGSVTGKETVDLLSGLTLDSMDALEIDDFGRIRKYGYSDGRATEITYAGADGSCGSCSSGSDFLIKSETDRTGLLTEYEYDELDRQVAVIRQGVQETMVYDAADRVIETWRVDEAQTVAPIRTGKTVYNLAGQMIESYDALDNLTTMAYSYPTEGGTVITTTHPATANGAGTRIETSFGDGEVKEISGTAISPMKYEYGIHALGEWSAEIKVSDVAGDEEAEWMQTFTDLAGRTFKMRYPKNTGDAPSDAEGAADVLATMSYNNLGQLFLQTDPDGVTTLYAYNAEGEREITAIDMNQNGVIDFNGLDRVTQTLTDVINSSGKVVNRVQTHVWQVDNADTETLASTSEQDAYGTYARQINSSGAITLSEINYLAGAGDWTQTQTLADGSQQVSTYTNGYLTNQQQLDNVSTAVTSLSMVYDPHGRLASQTDARTGTTSFSYSDRDEILTTTQENVALSGAGGGTQNLVTINTYDALGNLLSTTLPDNSVTVNEYFLRNNTLKKTSGSQTYMQEYTYDLQGRVKTLSTSNASGTQATSWFYDPQRGFMVAKIYPDTNGTGYTYTAAGRLAERLWARGVTTTYLYNNAGELTTTDYSDATEDITITYDRLGREKVVTDAAGTRTFTYATADLLLDNEVLPSAHVLSRSYEDGTGPTVSGRYSGYILEDAASSVLSEVTYAYDNAGRLSTVSDDIDTFTYSYLTNANLLSGLTSPVHSALYSYEPNRNVVTSMDNQVSGSSVSKYDYTYNKLTQRDTRQQSGSTFASTSTDSFTYNNTGELINADNNVNNNLDRSYNYDSIGNRMTATDNTGTTNYSVNSLNQYTTVIPDSDPGSSPSYDLDGNMLTANIDAQNRVLTYNGENRLISVEPATPAINDEKVDFLYDYQGRRIQKTVSTFNGSTWDLQTDQSFIYDSWNLIATIDKANGDALLKTYTWGMDLSGAAAGSPASAGQGAGGVGGLLKSSDGTFTYDANGNVSEIMDNAGTIQAHYEYDPFGNVVIATGALANENEFQFSTKYFDAETGLNYYGFRYYSADLGRWINRDPLEELDSINIYVFINNDSQNWFDILGLAGSRAGWNRPGTNPGAGWNGAIQDFINWVIGNTNYVSYGPNDPETKQIKKSQIASKLRKAFLDKNKSNNCFTAQDYTNAALRFRIKEFVLDLPNGTAHFVGSANGEVKINKVTNNGNLEVTFKLTNTTSLRSFLLHIIPNSWNNTNPSTPFSNWTQDYSWIEKFQCCPNVKGN